MCGLTLISSPHLARSYHHLFPVPRYDELQQQQVQAVLDLQLCVPHGSGAAAAQQPAASKSQLGQEGKAWVGLQEPPRKKVCVGAEEAGAPRGAALQGVGEVPYSLYCFGCLADLTPPELIRCVCMSVCVCMCVQSASLTLGALRTSPS